MENYIRQCEQVNWLSDGRKRPTPDWHQLDFPFFLILISSYLPNFRPFLSY